jgi:hypothetical protein
VLFRKSVFAAVLGATLFVGACKPESAQVGKDVADVGADTATLRAASEAVNEVVRSSADCEVARPLIPGATSKMDAAAPQLRTTTGRATLDALRSQVKKVQEACGS